MISNQTSIISMKEEHVRQSYVDIISTQDGFHSERHQTTQDIDHNSAHETTLNQIYPGLQFHIKYPVQTLVSHFKAIFNQHNFKVVEVFPSKIMITRLRFTDRIKKIFSSKEPPRYLLTIQTQQYRSMRTVLIKPLFQKMNEHPEIRQFYQWIEEPPVLPVKEPFRYEQDAESQYHQDIYSLEATSTYMFHKILVDKNYSLGKKMKKFIQESTSLEEENQILGGINEIADDMLQSFNCTRKQLLAILCYCRKTVQDYYHDRKYKYQTRQELDLKNNSISTQVSERIPLTIKCFLRMSGQTNSVSILRDLFLINYTFAAECKIHELSESEKKSLGEKVGHIFSKQLKRKTRVLETWKYSQPLYEQLLIPFI